MRLGIGTYTYAWSIGVPGAVPPSPMSSVELLDAAAQLGVRVVQFCDNLPLTALDASQLDEFESRARELNLEIELGTRGLGAENLRGNLALAQRFRCRFLRVVIDSAGNRPTPEEAVARLRRLLPEFERAGVMIAIENHDRFRSDVLAKMVEQLGTERAGICLDTVNSFGALESPEVVVSNLGPFTLCLHVKDFTITRVSHQMGFLVEGCAAGQGRLNVPWLLRELKASPHPFNAILETWVTPGQSLDDTIQRERAWAQEGVRYLRTLIPD